MNPRATHFGAGEVDLASLPFTPELLACIPAELVRKFRVVPVLNSPDLLTLSMSDPSDLDALDTLQRSVGRDLEICVAEADQLDEFINRLYG